MFILDILSAIFGFAKKNPAWTLVLLMGIVLGFDRIIISNRNATIAEQKVNIGKLQAVNTDYDTKNKQLNGQISDQNQSIRDLKKKGDDYNAQILAQQKKGDAVLATYKQRLADLQKEKTPTDCPGVMDKLLDDAIKGQQPPL